MAGPETIAQSYPAEVWKALLGSLTLVAGLVTILYNRLNKDIEAQSEQLAVGADTFRRMGEVLVEYSERLKVLESAEVATEEDVEKLREEAKVMHDKLLIIARECSRQHGTVL